VETGVLTVREPETYWRAAVAAAGERLDRVGSQKFQARQAGFGTPGAVHRSGAPPKARRAGSLSLANCFE